MCRWQTENKCSDGYSKRHCGFYVVTSSVAAVQSVGELLAGDRPGLKALGCPISGMPAAWLPGCHRGGCGVSNAHSLRHIHTYMLSGWLVVACIAVCFSVCLFLHVLSPVDRQMVHLATETWKVKLSTTEGEIGQKSFEGRQKRMCGYVYSYSVDCDEALLDVRADRSAHKGLWDVSRRLERILIIAVD